MNAVLVAERVSRRFGGVQAVDAVDMVAEQGQVTALVGPNGAGKSTLFACLAGQLRPDSGRVLLDGVDVTRRSADFRARHGLARTFQRLAAFPSLSVRENVALSLASQRGRGVLADVRRHDRSIDDQEVDAMLTALGLEHDADRSAAELSTGTLRLVELARALASRPRAVLLDEPTSGLDDVEVARVPGVLRRMADRGRAVVIVEHDLSLVFAAADVVNVLVGGRIVASGSPDEVRGEMQ